MDHISRLDYETNRSDRGQRTIGQFVTRMLDKMKRKPMSERPPMAEYRGAGAPLIPYPVSGEEAESIISALLGENKRKR